MDPYIIEKIVNDYIKIYPKLINYYKDKKFKVKGFDTLKKSQIEHFTLNIKTIFNNNTITIKYSVEDCILALEVMCIRIGDPFFNASYIKINDKKFKIKDNLVLIENNYIEPSVENLLVYTINELYSSNEIKIMPFSEDDYNYGKAILVYIENSLHHFDYYALKELDRWKS